MATYVESEVHCDTTMMHQSEHYQQTSNAYPYEPQETHRVDGNGYYIPPHAPRLTAAAARASSMASAYYNPWHHPMHPLNNYAQGGQGWNYRNSIGGGSLKGVPHLSPQHLEHQLGYQDSLSRGNHMSHYSAASAYGQEQQRQQQQHHYNHHNHPGPFQPRYSYPDDQANHRHQNRIWAQPNASTLWQWNNAQQGYNGAALDARHPSDATPTSYSACAYQPSAQQPKQYNDSRFQQFQHNVLQRNAEAFNYPPHHPQIFENPNSEATQGNHHKLFQDRSEQIRRSNNWENLVMMPSGYQNNWHQYYPQREQNHRVHHWPDSVAYMKDDDTTNGTANAWHNHPTVIERQELQHGEAPVLQDDTINKAPGDVLKEVAFNSAITGGIGDAVNKIVSAASDNAPPPPPSPATLDKSGVPISSVVAEIIWNSCAAFMDPDLLGVCHQRESKYDSRSSSRGRMSTSTSMPSSGQLSPLFSDFEGQDVSFQASSRLGTQSNPSHRRSLPVLHPLHRMTINSTGTTASSEDSSASSSEPGTPPSSFPTYLYDELQQSAEVKEGIGGVLQSSSLQNLSQYGNQNSTQRDLSLPPPLHRQGSFDQKQEVVLEALGLVSPYWRWSAYDEKLMSLTNRHSPSANQGAFNKFYRIDRMDESRRRGSSANARLNNHSINAEDSSPSGVSIFGNESSPAFRRFAHQVLAQTLSSPTALILALLYSLRISWMAVVIDHRGVASIDDKARDIFAQPPSAAPFKIFTLGLMIANKHLDDNTFLNKTWNEVTGISLSEINRMERWFLEKSSYEIVVPKETWIMFLERLGSKTERKLEDNVEDNKARQSKVVGHRGNSKTLGGLTYEESLKRLLFSVEDALMALGCIAPFQLNQLGLPSVRKRHASASPDMSTSATFQEPHPRPGRSLQHLHQQSQSAPVLTLNPSADASVIKDYTFDVFDDEDGPYRPQQSRHQSSIEQRDEQKRKSNQSFTWQQQEFLASENTHLNDQVDTKRGSSHPMSRVLDARAPLAPSVLLDLLNKGQQYAHLSRIQSHNQ